MDNDFNEKVDTTRKDCGFCSCDKGNYFCIALKELHCKNDANCRFYKNKSEVNIQKIKKECEVYALSHSGTTSC